MFSQNTEQHTSTHTHTLTHTTRKTKLRKQIMMIMMTAAKNNDFFVFIYNLVGIAAAVPVSRVCELIINYRKSAHHFHSHRIEHMTYEYMSDGFHRKVTRLPPPMPSMPSVTRAYPEKKREKNGKYRETKKRTEFETRRRCRRRRHRSRSS